MKQNELVQELWKPFIDNPYVVFLYTLVVYLLGWLYGDGLIVRTSMSLLCILICVDWVSGTGAAKRDDIDTSRYGISGVGRTMIVLMIPAAAHKIDLMLGIGTFTYYFTVITLARSVARSAMANIHRAGWTSHIPVDLLNVLTSWVANEIESKETRARERQEQLRRDREE